MQEEFLTVIYLFEAILKELKELKMVLIKREREFLSVAEACEFLNISKHTLYSYVAKRLLPFFKVQNKCLFFKISDLNNFILNKKNYNMSQEQIEQIALDEIESGK